VRRVVSLAYSLSDRGEDMRENSLTRLRKSVVEEVRKNGGMG